ncbi:hypothetical protein BY996DRAFT_6541942 [Phakopsora pachyrhizi]|nr:hypothetical protein BY996DRAFT_6541942 [Phakopsora pachyrhizi]
MLKNLHMLNKSSALTPCWVLGRQGRAAGLGPRQVAVRAAQVGLAGRLAWLGRAVGLTGAAGVWLGFAESEAGGAGQPGLGSDLLGWVLGRLAVFVGAGRSSRPGQSGQVWLAGRLAWLGRLGQSGQGSGASGRQGRAGAAGARLGFAGLGPRQGRAAGAWLGFAGLGPRQGRAARAWLGFAGLGPRQGRAARAWLGFAGLGPRQVGAAGARLGFAGLGPRQSRAARAWLGFAGLGPRQVAGRAGQRGRQVQPGLGLALLGWVLGRWQAGLSFAGLGPRQAGAAGAQLGFAGLGLRQAAAGQWGRQGHPGLGLAFLGWVLGRRQSGVGLQAGAAVTWLGFAGLGPRQVAVRAGQVGQVGHVGRLAGLAGQAGQAGAVRAGQAWLGFSVLGPGQVAVKGGAAGAWLGFAGLGPRQVAGRAGQQVVVRAGQVGHARAARAWLGLAVALSGWAGWAGGAGRERIKDSTLNKGPILALLDDTALPGAKAEAMDVESDGSCDDDNQMRPVHLLLRPAPYNEAADRLWEEIDQTLSVPEKLMLSGLKNKGDRGGRYIRDITGRIWMMGWKDWPRGFSDGAGSYPWLESGPRLRTGGAESDAAVDVADGMTGGQEPVMRMRRGNDGAGWIAAGSWAGWAVKGRPAGKGRSGGACKGSQGLAWLGWAGLGPGQAGAARARLGFAGLVPGQAGRAGLLTSEQMRPIASNS